MELEDLQNENLSLRDEIEKLKKQNDEILSQNNDYKNRISKLQEHNQELFIRCTSPVKEPHKEQDSIKLKTIEEIAKEMRERK